MKLDVSSKLMHYGETNRDEECLIVRSTLAEVFLIHQKYCFQVCVKSIFKMMIIALQTTVTKCLCERLNFEKLCEIGCSNLEPQGMAFDQRLTWKDYRGRLVSDSANRIAQALPFMMLFALSFSHSYHCLILWWIFYVWNTFKWLFLIKDFLIVRFLFLNKNNMSKKINVLFILNFNMMLKFLHHTLIVQYIKKLSIYAFCFLHRMRISILACAVLRKAVSLISSLQ